MNNKFRKKPVVIDAVKWTGENQKEIFSYANNKFLKESFGAFTNTIGNEHPDYKGHIDWANHLYEKLIEFNYIETKKLI